jgi:hypothetical protein
MAARGGGMLAVRIVFDQRHATEAYRGKGWAGPEEGHIWAIGTQSWLMLPPPDMRGSCLLSLTGWPHIRPGLLDSQKVAVMVNGYAVGSFDMACAGTLVSVVPPEAIAGKAALCIRLGHPDCARPTDFPTSNSPDSRRLAVAYQELTLRELAPDMLRLARDIRRALGRQAESWLYRAPPVADAVAKAEAAEAAAAFQSAGDDCEFGFVQRHLGIETLSLLRFSSMSIGNLTQGVLTGFDGIGEDGSLDILHYDEPDHDFMGRERRYGMLYHTMRRPGQISAETLKAQEAKRLVLLARKYLEDVENGEHLFVVKQKSPLLPEQIAILGAAFRKRGKACLLWVLEADEAHPPGSAGWVVPGVMAGYVARIDVSPLRSIDMEGWIAMCRSAYAVWRRQEVLTRS